MLADKNVHVDIYVRGVFRIIYVELCIVKGTSVSGHMNTICINVYMYMIYKHVYMIYTCIAFASIQLFYTKQSQFQSVPKTYNTMGVVFMNA